MVKPGMKVRLGNGIGTVQNLCTCGCGDWKITYPRSIDGDGFDYYSESYILKHIVRSDVKNLPGDAV